MRTAHVGAHLAGTRRRTTPASPSTGIACRVGRARGAGRARCPRVVHSARNVRTSVRKPFVDRGWPAPSHSGQRPRPSASSSASPSSRSWMSWSSSPPVSSCGGSSPAATSAARTSWNANEATDRASGPEVARPTASASRSRSAVAVWRDGVSTSSASGSTPRLDQRRDPRDERGRLAGARGADHDTGCRGRQCHDGALLRRPEHAPRRVRHRSPWLRR